MHIPVPNPLSNPDAVYTLKLDHDASGNLVYAGLAPPGSLTSAATWQIRRMTYTALGYLDDLTYAGGAPTFVNVWDNRDSLAYS